MKHFILSALLCAVSLIPSMVRADEPLELELGGFSRFYMSGVQQNERVRSVRPFNILRDVEIHFDAKKTFHPELTIAVHIEYDMTNGLDSPDESNVSFLGNWGKLIYGDEDAASYLLQVAAPAADGFVDGLSQYFQPVNYAAAGLAGGASGEEFDYDQTLTSDLEKLTYITPIMGGLQFGASYTPDTKDLPGGFYAPRRFANRLNGNSLDNQAGAYGEVYDGAIRYEAKLADDVKLTLGTGITSVQLEKPALGLQNFNEWNAGANLQYKDYAIGYAHQTNNGGLSSGGDEHANVIGVNYRDGKTLWGGSVYHQSDESFANTGVEVDTLRYSLGVGYDYAPGLSFRGSVARIQHDVKGGKDVNATYALFGTLLSF